MAETTGASGGRRRRWRLSTKLLLFGELVLLLLVFGMIVPIRASMRMQVIEDIQRELRSVASTAALQLDGDLHQAAVASGDVESRAFLALRSQLRAIAAANGYSPDNIYTYSADAEEGVLRFAVMIHEEPFLGDPYKVKAHQAMAWQTGGTTTTGLFEDRYGQWLASVAPIRDRAGRVVGLLEVAKRADAALARIDQTLLVTGLAAVGGLVLASLAGWLALQRIVIRPVRKIHEGMQALAAHDFKHRTEVRTGDELEDLAEALNTMSTQLNAARAIQAGFMPKAPPDAPGYRFAYRSDPCDATGGDYLDAFGLPNGDSVILLADVTGHGLGPSLIMASCRSALRALAQEGLEPGELMRRLERQLAQDLTEGRFITMVLGVLRSDGRLTYANAGHAPAMVVRGGAVEQLGSHRPPLGLFSAFPELAAAWEEDEQTTVELSPGDRVVFTSDGVNESQDVRDEFFGMGPIEAAAQRGDWDADQVVSQLSHQLVLHRADRPADDDVTMLCVDRVEGEVAERDGVVVVA
ncbi:MAG: SpoIIE family protein phosphatase [Planctomycetota bacterium]